MLALYEYLDRVKAQGNPESILESLRVAVASLGFSHSAYYVIRPPASRPALKNSNTYPRHWQRRYTVMDFRNVDATHPVAAAMVMPFRWDRIISIRPVTEKQRLLFDEAREFGIASGITIPLHGPENGLATLNLSGNLTEAELNNIWETRRFELILIGTYTHEAMLRCVESDSHYTPLHLTDRERECLTWTSQGKTAWEVAQVLSLSEDTVAFHLRNAMRKLGVFSKHHAVVKAIMRGLIVP